MSHADDVAAWIEHNLTLNPGEPLRLSPWQEAVLAQYRAPSRLERVELGLRTRRGGRQRETARIIAAALISGETTTVVSIDRASARAMYDAVREELDVWGRLLDADVAELLERLPR